MKKTIMVSGGFDPVHVGHLRMFQEASKHGRLIVALNSDDWLKRKKGYVFMPFEERKEIIQAFSCVSSVTHIDDEDNSACEAIERIHPDIFANGGDRFANNTPETLTCIKYDIETLWGVGGGKIQSSSDMVKNAKE